MRDQGSLTALVGQIYDAAADPNGWSPFLENLGVILRAPWCTLYLHDFASSQVDIAARTGFEPDYVRRYEEYYAARNVYLVHGKEQLAPGVVCLARTLCPDRLLERSEFYNDWVRPQGIGSDAVIATVLQMGSLVGILGCLRAKGSRPVSPRDVASLRPLMPHLRRALQFHSKLTELQAIERPGSQALDRWPVGVMVLDRDGRVLSMNRAAESLGRRNDGLVLDPHGLRTVSSSESARLRLLIHGAVAQRAIAVAPDGVMHVSRSPGKRPLSLLVAPIASAQILGGAPQAACVVFISDPEAEPELPEDVLRRLFALTAAESKVAARLTQGRSIGEIADEQHVTVHTTRTHVKRVLAKTRTRRQSELVMLVLRSVAAASTQGSPQTPTPTAGGTGNAARSQSSGPPVR